MHRSSTRSRVLAAFALVALAACSEQGTSPLTAPAQRSIASLTSRGIPTGKTVVVFKDTSSIPLAGKALLASVGTVTTSWDDIGVAIVTGVSADALATLSASDLVAAVGQDRILSWLPNTKIGGTVDAGIAPQARNNPSGARYMMDGSQWGMRMIRADAAWAAGHLGTASTRVAILDTGLDYDHRELKGLVDLAASASFSHLIVAEAGFEASVPVEPQVPGDQPYMDNHFHGTHVGATVASNNISVAGVAPNVTLIAVKVLNFLGSGSFEGVASGIRHAADVDADIINMSLGANVDVNEAGVPALLEMMSRVIRAAEKKGTIVISAAGNDAIDLDVGSLVSTPCEQSTICVSATGPLLQQNFDQAATYTNYGITAIEVAAPGGNAVDGDDSAYQTEDLIIGACSRRASSGTLNVCKANTDGVAYFYAWAAGTSMASPHVAGAAALIKSAQPTLSVKGLANKLMRSADDVQAPGRDVYSNWGRINVARALGIE